MSELNCFFDKLWQQYIAITPQALKIQGLFQESGERIINDHVAFRTYADSAISIDELEKEIKALGYQFLDEYYFENKKLYARCYTHAESETKIFLSELQWLRLSDSSQKIIQSLLQQINPNAMFDLSVGRLWSLPTFDDYQFLLQESEYAAWLSVWGLRANHFTVYVNALEHYDDITAVVDMLIDHDQVMNVEGGVIKGTKEDYLIQASTMADKIDVQFEDVGIKKISSCYYEFAQRFRKPEGNMYLGFVPASADKIFESTNAEPGGGDKVHK